MRVWLAPSAFAPHLGGIEELSRQLARQLRGLGHEVRVVTSRWPEALSQMEVVDSIQVNRLVFPAPGLHPGRLSTYRARRRHLHHELDSLSSDSPPDVVHAIGASWQAHHLAEYSVLRRWRFVLTLQGETVMDDHHMYERGIRSILARRALRRSVASSATVTACSEWALDRAAAIAPETARGVVIPNGVDLQEMAGIPPPPPTGPMLAYGRLVRNKGFDLLINAWADRQTELWIGGEGPERSTLETDAARALGTVRFLGRLDRPGVVDALARARAVVMPSRLEPFGIVALEAMAAGRPVVASSIGGAREFLAGGVLVDPHDHAALRAAMGEALMHPEWGLEGRAAAQSFGWDRITHGYVREYESPAVSSAANVDATR